MMMDDYDGQMIFGDLEGLELPDIRLTGEEKPRKNLTQETCPDQGLNLGPLRDKRACYHLFHSGLISVALSVVNDGCEYSVAVSVVNTVLHNAVFNQTKSVYS